MKKLIFIITMQFSGLGNAAYYYNITNLGTLGQTQEQTLAFDINNKGQIVGQSVNNDDFGEAFVYENGVMMGLGGLVTGFNSQAFSINENNQIVGASDNGSYNEAFIYENGVMNGLGTLGGNVVSQAHSINDQGQVVGLARNSSNFNEAFIYENGSMTGLGWLANGQTSSALSINNQGQIVGFSDNGSYNEAFIYENGVMNGLGTLGGENSFANAINELGKIVGSANNGSYNEAFIYENGVMNGLGTLGHISVATDINIHGQIVGRSGSSNIAFLYEDNYMYSLMDLIIGDIAGWAYLNAAYSINDNGQITGWGKYQGKSSAFLLDPTNEMIPPPITVPEPSTFWLVCLGLVGFKNRRGLFRVVFIKS